jgi:hypothetical protein
LKVCNQAHGGIFFFFFLVFSSTDHNYYIRRKIGILTCMEKWRSCLRGTSSFLSIR